jgi:hypothetical protein
LKEVRTEVQDIGFIDRDGEFVGLERDRQEAATAEAVNHTLSQWEALNVFTRDGTVAIDNNVSEREMKRVVLNRKNSLFVGNPRGGRTAAILASLTSSCRRHDADPQLYFMQLLVNPSCAARHWRLSWISPQSTVSLRFDTALDLEEERQSADRLKA